MLGSSAGSACHFIAIILSASTRLTGHEPAGTLTIGSPESLCIHRLPPVLSQFHARFPRVQVIFRPGFGFELRRALVEGQADMCFLIEEPLRAPDLVVEPLVHERL